MLFNSLPFFLFLAICLLGYQLLAVTLGRGLQGWLLLCSLAFYGWWEPVYLLLIGTSIGLNFVIGEALRRQPRKWLLGFGITANLAALAWFKYAGFLSENIGALFGQESVALAIVLPLAISFFTFQQIAFLVDSQRGLTSPASLGRYALFVSFFPQLVAGPIVHHSGLLPQLDRLRPLQSRYLAIGITIFVIGLSKKLLVADSLFPEVQSVYGLLEQGVTPNFWEAWLAAVMYSLYIYFDFSGYSDMALGLAALFGVRLPLNFNSPYKATSIVDFWRRWHITLSSFLRDYLYIALGGNRFGTLRRYSNLFITMLLGGLWHGAGWNFVLWGGAHGALLVINHAWGLYAPVFLRRLFGLRFIAMGLTFVTVTIVWVFFHANSFSEVSTMLSAMLLPANIPLPAAFDGLVASGTQATVWAANLPIKALALTLPLLLLWVWFAPNTQQVVSWLQPSEASVPQAAEPWWGWRPNAAWAIVVAGLALTALVLLLSSPAKEFLYFEF